MLLPCFGFTLIYIAAARLFAGVALTERSQAIRDDFCGFWAITATILERRTTSRVNLSNLTRFALKEFKMHLEERQKSSDYELVNLFAELELVLAQNGKIWSDVRAVGSADGFIDLAKFKQLAEATDYDNDWGLYEVPLDLRVELDDMVLVRREYDGKEWWETVKFRLVNLNRKLDVKRLKDAYRTDLKDLA